MNSIVGYLTDLAQNNNREWFHAHKIEYAIAQAEFEELIQMLILETQKFDTRIALCDPKTLTFKLQRDTRFSRDKSPYNPAFRCHIAPAGKAPVPVGYFLSVKSDGRSFLGGGLFADMWADATQRVRMHIYEHADEFFDIVNAPEFRQVFNVEGTRLKNVPKEFPVDCIASEYLKNKSWYIEYPFDAERLDDRAEFTRYAAETFKLMKPFNDFLNRALEGFKLPMR